MHKLLAGITILLASNVTIPAAFAKNITVFAASSLSESVSTIAKAYNENHDVKIRTVFAASSTLARQIARGAPADIYISANQKWLTYLVEQDKISEKYSANILQNSLVVAAPSDSTIAPFTLNKDTDLKQLLGKGRLATGNTDHVPVGIYAKQALTALGLWQSVQNKLALSSNTRAALAFIERKAVPFGLVYNTDAIASDKVKVLSQVPMSSHSDILYPLALVNRSTDEQDTDFSSQALSVYQYFLSENAMKVFQQYGFKTLNNVN